MAIRVVECLDWKTKHKPGELLRFAEHFKKSGVNLDALWAYKAGKSAKLVAIGKKPAKLKASLKKLRIKPKSSRWFALSGKDKAGALISASKALAKARINIECVDAMAAQGKFASTFLVRPSAFAKAKKVLKARG